MENFIPLEKQSKKARREYNAKKRGSWNGVNPVTKTVPNGKAYNRNKLKQAARRDARSGGLPAFFALCCRKFKICHLIPDAKGFIITTIQILWKIKHKLIY